MTTETFLAFCVAYALAVSVPGPFIAAMVARTIAQGPRTGIAMNAGAGLGDLVWASLTLFGLALIAGLIAPLLAVLKYVGAAYIVWIGYRLIASKPAAPEAMAMRRESAGLSFLAGLTITLGNPKPIAFFLAVMPGIFDLASLTLADKMLILCVIPFILTAVLSAYALTAARARRVLSSARAVQRINRGAGAAMIGAGTAIAAG